MLVRSPLRMVMPLAALLAAGGLAGCYAYPYGYYGYPYDYQQRTDREIPVFVASRKSDG